MEIYLVGGAVRDELLNLPVIEKDYVVVGGTPEDMIKRGYRQVGKDFPVFLHPETHEEYALARVERKTAPGYIGFSFDASPKVTLEEDLLRRDLTINAIAKKTDGTLIDPFHGQEDLRKKLLRHVSPAFIEDPVRILRVGRFASRFTSLGFTVASETTSLMQAMVHSGEVDALVPERVWRELVRTLEEDNPEVFFQVLISCDASHILFPTLRDENLEALKKATKATSDPEIRFSAMLYDHSADQIKTLCTRYRIPSNYQELALIVAGHHNDYLSIPKFTPEQFIKLFKEVDAFRREERFKKLSQACSALHPAMKSIDKLSKVFQAAKEIDTKSPQLLGLKGKEIGEAILAQRLTAIKKYLR